MVISNLNTKLVEDRLGRIVKSLARLKGLAETGEDEFLRGDGPAVAESHLRRSLEAAFDIGRHILAKTAGGGIVEYKEIAEGLASQGVVTRDLGGKLRLMAGYRNRLVHFYHEIDDREIHSILRNNLADLQEYVEAIRDFIQAHRSKHG